MPTIHSIQFLRFVAALLVVFNHCIVFSDAVAGVSISEPWLYLGRFGRVGVHIFFVISGLVITYTTHRHFGDRARIPRFLLRRFVRIYPIYWAHALLGLGLAILLGGAGELSVLKVIRSLLLLPEASSDLVFTGWSLSYEVFFYGCFGLILAARGGSPTNGNTALAPHGRVARSSKYARYSFVLAPRHGAR